MTTPKVHNKHEDFRSYFDKELVRRFENLRLSNPESKTSSLPDTGVLPQVDNPFNSCYRKDKSDSIPFEDITSTFEDIHIKGNSNLEKYLSESITNDSPFTFTELNSVNVMENGEIKISLAGYSKDVLVRASKLAQDISGSLSDGKLPFAFERKQMIDVVSSEENPLMDFSEGFLRELYGRLFHMIDSMGQTSYGNLVELLNSVNTSSISIDSAMLLSFVALLTVPKITRSLKNTVFNAPITCQLVKYDLTFMVYNAIILTPKYKDFVLKLKGAEEYKILQKDLAKLAEKRLIIAESYAVDFARSKKETQELKRQALVFVRFLGYGALGLACVLLSYKVFNFLKTRTIMGKHDTMLTHKPTEKDLRYEIKRLEEQLKNIDSKKKEFILGESLFNIALLKLRHFFHNFLYCVLLKQ